MTNVHSNSLIKANPSFPPRHRNKPQTLPVPGEPPPWTTKIKLNKGGSFTAFSREISCLLSILICLFFWFFFKGGFLFIFWSFQQLKTLFLVKLWDGNEGSWLLFLAGGIEIKGTFREVYPHKHNQRGCSQ